MFLINKSIHFKPIKSKFLFPLSLFSTTNRNEFEKNVNIEDLKRLKQFIKGDPPNGKNQSGNVAEAKPNVFLEFGINNKELEHAIGLQNIKAFTKVQQSLIPMILNKENVCMAATTGNDSYYLIRLHNK